jgi:alpha-glucosidase
MEKNDEDSRAGADDSASGSGISRRRAIKAIACTVGAMALTPSSDTSQRAATAAGTFKVGQFLVDVARAQIRVRHQASLSRLLWESTSNQSFLVVGIGTATFREHGNPLGSFDVTDTVASQCAFNSVDSVQVRDAASIALYGTLVGADSSTIGFRLVFRAAADNQLQFVINLEGNAVGRYNRIFLTYASSPDEAFFGFGQQLTYFNQKGNVIPVVVQEHGIGRGLPIVTPLVDLLYDGAGGTPYLTEAPAPQYISSQLRSLFLENKEYSVFDMRAADYVTVKLFSGTMTGRILFGATPLDLIEEYTSYSGRVRPLPAWAHEGVMVATEGGSATVNALLAKLTDANVPLVGLWIQDWSGSKTTAAGHQVQWNWQLSSELYPDWNEIVEKLAQVGARVFIYINPFLVPLNCDSTDAGNCPRDLYQEALNKGYLVKKKGTTFTYINSSIRAGMLDLSNPDARLWIKQLIKKEMIGTAKASGWMGDFGEALPFDADLYAGADPYFWHNHYPEAWAQVQREAINETGHGDDFLFWNRSGFSKSPTYSTAGWLGDQLQTWDGYDGIKTAVVGMLSGGMSGFSVLHSDTGGFVAAQIKGYPVIARTTELLMRWMELSAFTALFRTHAGLIPSISAQVDTDAQTLSHLVRFALVFKSLAFYRKGLVASASNVGYPVVRHLFLHYPSDTNVYTLRYQYLLGSEFLIAPVLDQGATSVNVYLPAGDWVHLWSGTVYRAASGEWIQIGAPLGQPGVFFKKGSAAGTELVRRLRQLKIL